MSNTLIRSWYGFKCAVERGIVFLSSIDRKLLPKVFRKLEKKEILTDLTPERKQYFFSPEETKETE